jgi:hypothetical protein
MKYTFLFLCSICFFSCGPIEGDSSASVDSSSSNEPIIDSVPRDFIHGKPANYAFKPDTAFKDWVLGSAESFAVNWRKLGSNMKKVGDNRWVTTYLCDRETEWLAIYLCKNKKGKETPYGFVMQKNEQPGAPENPNPDNMEYSGSPNILTGHGIHIGMTTEYLTSIYTGQKMQRWIKGDTLYYQFKGQGKDAGWFTRYGYQSYVATYKLVNDKIRRIECFVDPAELEK